jgi:hypothetical protein
MRKNQSATSANAPQNACEEINAYIAIRNNLLAVAEKSPTSKAVASAASANDFVEDCLLSPRSPYQAQYLQESEAACERKVCRKAKQRIAELRAALV